MVAGTGRQLLLKAEEVLGKGEVRLGGRTGSDPDMELNRVKDQASHFGVLSYGGAGHLNSLLALSRGWSPGDIELRFSKNQSWRLECESVGLSSPRSERSHLLLSAGAQSLALLICGTALDGSPTRWTYF